MVILLRRCSRSQISAGVGLARRPRCIRPVPGICVGAGGVSPQHRGGAVSCVHHWVPAELTSLPCRGRAARRVLRWLVKLQAEDYSPVRDRVARPGRFATDDAYATDST